MLWYITDMRLPLSKVYRAFSELDPFTDEQCQGYVTTARRTNELANAWFMFGVFACVVPGSCIGGGFAAYLAIRAVGYVSELEWRLCVMLAFIAVGVGVPSLGGLMARDAWLRRLIRRQLERCSCPTCRYSLLGLAPSEGHVVCPECGSRHSLVAMGLTPVDILVPILKSDPSREPIVVE